MEQQYDASRPCPKCGFGMTKDTFEDEYIPQGLIFRKCLRCGYEWAELPLDRKPEDYEQKST